MQKGAANYYEENDDASVQVVVMLKVTFSFDK